MSEPKTKTGAPRKRAPGAGRPCAGRSVRLPRVSEDAGAALALVQAALARPGLRPPTLADAVEMAALLARDVVEGADARGRWADARREC